MYVQRLLQSSKKSNLIVTKVCQYCYNINVTNDKERTNEQKYLNVLETISDILQSNGSDATKLKLIGDAVDALNKF